MDTKDLRPIKATEIIADGVFYRKEADGSYSYCKFSAWELQRRGKDILAESKNFELFVRISKPWEALEK